MGIFAKNTLRECKFDSCQELIDHFLEEIEDTEDIVSIITDYNDFEIIFKTLMKSGDFNIRTLEYDCIEDSRYIYEYEISAFNDGETKKLFVERVWYDDKHDYLNSEPECTEVVFMSKNASPELIEKYKNKHFNIVLYSIDE